MFEAEFAVTRFAMKWKEVELATVLHLAVSADSIDITDLHRCVADRFLRGDGRWTFGCHVDKRSRVFNVSR
jgi:hypothetical protein